MIGIAFADAFAVCSALRTLSENTTTEHHPAVEDALVRPSPSSKNHGRLKFRSPL